MRCSQSPPSCQHGHISKRAIGVTTTYPVKLHLIKALFGARQYKQCIQKCEALDTAYLEEDAAQIAFVSFYAASANDCLAALMHDFSPAKIPTLELAEALYLRAIDAIAASSPHSPVESNETIQHHSHADEATDPGQTPKTSCEAAEYTPTAYSASSTQALSSHASYDDMQTPTRNLGRGISFQDMRLPPPHMQRFTPVASPQVMAWRPNFALSGIGPSRLATPNDRSAPSTPTRVPRTISFMDLGPVRNIGQSSPFDNSPPSRFDALNPRPLPPLPRTVSSNCLDMDTSPRHFHSSAFTPLPLFSSTLSTVQENPPSFSNAIAETPPPAQIPVSTPPTIKSSMEQQIIDLLQRLRAFPSLEANSNESLRARADHAISSTTVIVSPETEHLSSNLQALQTQIQKHLTRLRIIQKSTHAAQNERSIRRAQIQAGLEKGKLPRSRSYWSFDEPKAKDTERTKRIEEGRTTGWKRERFCGEKYQKLARIALDELGVSE